MRSSGLSLARPGITRPDDSLSCPTFSSRVICFRRDSAFCLASALKGLVCAPVAMTPENATPKRAIAEYLFSIMFSSSVFENKLASLLRLCPALCCCPLYAVAAGQPRTNRLIQILESYPHHSDHDKQKEED